MGREQFRDSTQKSDRLSSMPSEIGLTMRTRVMYVHTLVDTAWNQTAAKPTAEKCDQKSRNVGNQTRRGGGLCVDFGMAARADHVRCLWADRNDRGNDGRTGGLVNGGRKGAGRRDAAHGLRVAGRCRRGRYVAIGRRWRLFTHFVECFFGYWPTLMEAKVEASNGESLTLLLCTMVLLLLSDFEITFVNFFNLFRIVITNFLFGK